MKVEIRPIDRNKWHGKKGKESFAQPHTIQALVNSDTMTYAVDIKEERLKELEEMTNYNLNLLFNPEVPHEFWDSRTAKVKLENRTMFLDISVPLNEIKLGILKGSKFVANSLSDYNLGKYPNATHYIHNESEEVEISASKISMRNTAILETAKLTRERKIDIIKVLSGGSLKENSENFLTVAVDMLIEKDVELYLQTIKRNKKEVSYLALVHEALDKGVLRRDGHNIKYFDSSLGMTEEDVANYLMDEINQEFALIIKQKTKE